MTPRVVHVITALRTGGAERMLARLLAASPELRRGTSVITLVPGGELESAIGSLGVPVRSLGLARGQVSPAALGRLAGLLQRTQAQVVHGWMYHADIAVSLAMIAARRRTPVIWNIRHALHAHRTERRLTAFLIRAGALLSRHPRRIVYNSATSRAQHAALGYDDTRAVVIPNGFIVADITPHATWRAEIRRELGLAEDVPVLGVMARFDPLKDFPMLFAALEQAVARRPEVRLVVAGEGASWDNAAFARLVDATGLRGHVLPLGRREDVDRLVAAFDIVLSPSLSEAFPNAVGEAMAARVPCVVTDVGDCRRLVGDTGRVVPPREPAAFAGAVLELLELPAAGRQALGVMARERIAREFSIGAVAQRYEALHADVAGGA